MNRWTDDELRRLAMGPESARVERKRQITKDEKKKIQQTLCAFANDILGEQEPGVLFIGLEDDGQPSGRPVDDGLIRGLEDFVTSGALHPRPLYEIRRLTLPDGSECAVLVIEPHPQPPVRFNGDVFVRRGSLVVRATPEDERKLAERNRAAELPFVLRSPWGVQYDDLDPVLANEYIERIIGPETRAVNHRPLPLQLKTLRLLSADGLPTHLGVLLVGRDPAAFLPTAYIQLIRFAGITVTSEILDQLRANGPLLTLLPRVLELLDAWNPESMDTSGIRHVIHPRYPKRALREALVNAVVHRDYQLSSPIYVRWFADRVEVTSPGGLHPPVTSANLADGAVTAYRNERLAEAMMRLGHAQHYGLGIHQILQSMKDNGNPEPTFDVGEHHVRVILRAVAKQSEQGNTILPAGSA